MKITTDTEFPVTLLKTAHKKFVGRDGTEVEYNEAVILDNEGNKFSMSVSKENSNTIMGYVERKEGVAEIETFIVTKDGRDAIKMRLINFLPAVS